MENQKLTQAFIKSIIGTLLFALIYLFANIQFIKEIAEDTAFDTLHKFVLVNDSTSTRSPHVLIFGIDDYYLRPKGLIEENNQTNYGYFFPRDRLAQLIEKIDITLRLKGFLVLII